MYILEFDLPMEQRLLVKKNIDISDTNPGERTHNIDQDIVDAWLVGEE